MRITRDLIHSLMASTAMTFVISGLMGHKKFAPEDIQNATLAGGVVVGASADMVLQVGAPILTLISIDTSAANRLIGEVVQSRGKWLLPLSHLRHY